jgi:hypothetical protein
MNRRAIYFGIIVAFTSIVISYYSYDKSTETPTSSTSGIKSSDEVIKKLCDSIDNQISTLSKCTDDEQNIVYTVYMDTQGFETQFYKYYDIEGNLIGKISYTMGELDPNQEICKYKGKKCSEFNCLENIC